MTTSTIKTTLNIAQDRGWSVYMQTTNNELLMFKHKYYPMTLCLWPETNEFELNHNTGLFSLNSGKCGSFDKDEQYNMYFNQMLMYLPHLMNAQDDIRQRNMRKVQK